MKKIKIYTLTILFFLILQSCGTVKESFSSQKKNSSDEFFVEKKSPLVMPPDFDELPLPISKSNEDQLQENSNNMKFLFSSNEETTPSTEKNETNQNLERTILKKIKNN